MSFSLNTNSIIGNKMREEMYLKHLRQVERINNREADNLRKQLQYYRSISELHRNNKDSANRLKVEGNNRTILDKNVKIFEKIQKMESDQQLRHSAHTLLATLSTVHPKNDPNQAPLQPAAQLLTKGPIKNEHMKALHYRYRKKQQQRIEEQNTKIFRAISAQKSMLLPLIGKSRCSSDLNKSAQTEAFRTRRKQATNENSQLVGESEPQF